MHTVPLASFTRMTIETLPVLFVPFLVAMHAYSPNKFPPVLLRDKVPFKDNVVWVPTFFHLRSHGGLQSDEHVMVGNCASGFKW